MIDAIETLEGEMNAGSYITGSSDYNELKNKPSINGVELVGAKTLEELNIQPKGDYAEKADIPTVPTKLSELENDSKYITSEYVDEKLGDIETILSTLVTPPAECEHINTTFVEYQESDNADICKYMVSTCNDCGETVKTVLEHDTYERTAFGRTYIFCHNCDLQVEKEV